MFAFDPTSGLRDTVSYPTNPASETAAREQFQGLYDQLKFYNNKHGAIVQDAGSVNALALTLSTDVIANTDILLNVNPAYTNTSTSTGTPTVNVNALGDIPIYRNSTYPLLAGDIQAGAYATLVYSTVNTAYQLLNPQVPVAGLTAGYNVTVNASTNQLEWKAGIHSLLTAGGDIVVASGTTPSKLGVGNAYENLSVNATTDGLSYSASLQSLMTAKGDIVYASADYTPASLNVGTAYQSLGVNATTDAPAYMVSPNSLSTQAGDMFYANGVNSLAKLGIGSAGQVLKTNATTDAPEWGEAIVTAYGVETDTATSLPAGTITTKTIALGVSPNFAEVALKRCNAASDPEGVIVYITDTEADSQGIETGSGNQVRSFKGAGGCNLCYLSADANIGVFYSAYIDGTDLKIRINNGTTGSQTLKANISWRVWE